MKIIGEIPARLGSKRVLQKNLRLLCGKPLIEYAIAAAKKATVLSDIYVNSESATFGEIARINGVNYYKRQPELAEDSVTSDRFNYDFLKHVSADVLVMINPVSPLITGDDIDDAVNYFVQNGLDTLIPVREEKLQAFCEGKSINFNPDGILPMTQNIPPIQLCVWSICVWKAKTFMKSYEEKGYAVFSGKVGFYPLSPLKAVKISTDEDFMLAEALMKYRGDKKINGKV